MNYNKLKIAVIQDQLLTPAGSERVFLQICKAFPSADIYTFCYNKNTTLSEFKYFNIKVHPLGRFIRSHKVFKLLFPISTFVIRYWSFNDYDLIISSSATISKYVKKGGAKHLCYCYTPTRALWFPDDYFGSSISAKFALFFLNPIFKYLRYRDLRAADNVDFFIAISKTTQKRISNIYRRSSMIINSPVDTDKFFPSSGVSKDNFFLLVSRLEKWKNLDYVIKAFSDMELPLLVIGSGPELDRLRSIAKKNIIFLGFVPDSQLTDYYQRSRAVIFPTDLEFGLVPLEANACGTPVIALSSGGVQETMVWETGDTNATAVLFNRPETIDLIRAVIHFNSKQFTPSALKNNAARFDSHAFRQKLINFVSFHINIS